MKITNQFELIAWIFIIIMAFIIACITIVVVYVIFKKISKNKGTIKVSKNGVEIDTDNNNEFINIIEKNSDNDRMVIIVETVRSAIERIDRLKSIDCMFEQMTQIERKNHVMCSEMLNVVIKCSGVPSGTDLYRVYSDFFDKIFIYTLDLMRDFCKNNHFAEKSQDEWTAYKKMQYDYIKSRVIQYMDENCNRYINGEEIRKNIKACGKDIFEVYGKYIYDVFDIARNIAIEKQTHIEKLENEVENIKRGVI